MLVAGRLRRYRSARVEHRHGLPRRLIGAALSRRCAVWRRPVLLLIPIVVAGVFVAPVAEAAVAARPADAPSVQAAANCVGGVAAGYPCNRVDLLAELPLAAMGGGSGSGGWGW